MEFGEWPVEETKDMLIAHSRITPYGKLKKGDVMTGDDITALQALGLTHVSAARLEPGDMDENEVARMLAAAVARLGLEVRDMHTGRCNLHAVHDGVLQVDESAVLHFNLADEAVTLATLANKVPVRAGQMLATVKVIPFSLSRQVFSAIEAKVSDLARGMLEVRSYRRKRVGFIQTWLPGTRDTVLDKTSLTLMNRLANLGGGMRLSGESRCAHESGALRRTMMALNPGKECDLIVISGASATVDANDVVPTAIREAGGRVERVGMPVDPGNLIVLGSLDDIPVIGMPGCARSPKLNGFDKLLWRLAANIPVCHRDIAAMGVGGLLNDAKVYLQSRDDKSLLASQRFTAVVLAAGLSRRMGQDNKLLMSLNGEPMVRRVVRAALGSLCQNVMVIVGHGAPDVRKALHGMDVDFMHNPDYEEGLGSSVRCAATAVGDDTGVLMCLGDMPLVTSEVLDQLIKEYDPTHGVLACQAAYGGKRGNPVLWGPEFLPELRSLQGDEGARSLLGRHPDSVALVEVQEPGVLLDIDTPLDFNSLISTATARFKR